MHPIVEQIRALPVAERLQIVGQIWRDIASSSEPITLKDEELAEIERRIEAYNRDASIAIDEEELWRRMDGKGFSTTTSAIQSN